MSLLKRLFGKKQFRRFPDSFTLSKANKMATLCQWVREQADQRNTVLVLCHFQSTFLENQLALQKANIEYDILARPLSEDQFVRRIQQFPADERGPVVLTMAQMFRPTELSLAQRPGKPVPDRMPKLSVIVTERYPMIVNDQKLERFLIQVDALVSLGYLISYDDPILIHLLGERFIELLRQLGLGENDLVSSSMTNRGLSRKLHKATAAIEQEQLADSPDEWIELNLD